MEINAEMLAKALWETSTNRSSDQPEKWDDLDEEMQGWLCSSADVVLKAMSYPKPGPGEIGYNRYANLVAEIYAIEGQQIKPDDPRLQLPDNRCPQCVATINEPQPLTPVRRRVHEMLQNGGHIAGHEQEDRTVPSGN